MSNEPDARPWQVWVQYRDRPQFREGKPTDQITAMNLAEKLLTGKHKKAARIWCEEDV